MNLLEDPTELSLGKLRDKRAAKKRATDSNPNSTPDPMTARTSPTWDNNPNHKPDPMRLYAFDSPVLSLHHSGAYSVPPVDANVNVDVTVPEVPTLNLKRNG